MVFCGEEKVSEKAVVGDAGFDPIFPNYPPKLYVHYGLQRFFWRPMESYQCLALDLLGWSLGGWGARAGRVCMQCLALNLTNA